MSSKPEQGSCARSSETNIRLDDGFDSAHFCACGQAWVVRTTLSGFRLPPAGPGNPEQVWTNLRESRLPPAGLHCPEWVRPAPVGPDYPSRFWIIPSCQDYPVRPGLPHVGWTTLCCPDYLEWTGLPWGGTVQPKWSGASNPRIPPFSSGLSSIVQKKF